MVEANPNSGASAASQDQADQAMTEEYQQETFTNLEESKQIEQQMPIHPLEQPQSEAAMSHPNAADPQAQSEPEQIDTDCNVCFTTMCEPCVLPCKHAFCLICIRTFFQQKQECPMCRGVPPQNFKLIVDSTLQKQIQKAAPEAYKDRVTALRKENAFSGDFVDLKICFGNRHRLVPARGSVAENTHQWTMFVKFINKDVSPNRLIEKVRFGLHETFGMDYMDVKASASEKFEMEFTGWGTFQIPITIYFRRELCLTPEQRRLQVDHMLNFEGNGKWRTISLPLKKTVAIKLGIPTK